MRHNRYILLIMLSIINLGLIGITLLSFWYSDKFDFNEFCIFYDIYFLILSLSYLYIYSNPDIKKLNVISIKNLKTNFNLFFLSRNKIFLINNAIALMSFSIILGLLGIKYESIFLILILSELLYLFVLFTSTYTINYIVFWIALYLYMIDLIFHFNISSWNPLGSLFLNIFS
jgi:hypothetical protein